MLIKPIKTSAKSMTEQSSISPFSQTSLGICGRRFSMFAKSILDKYTKVINYQFDYASLIFLEQAAGEGEWKKNEINNTIIVTWKLLSFLLNHKTNQKQFLYQNPVLLQQMIQKVENNLLEIKLKDKKIYQDMKKYYEIYRKESALPVRIKNDKVEDEKKEYFFHWEERDTDQYSAEIDYIEQQIERYEEQQRNRVVIKKEKVETGLFTAPFTMSRSFFVNLNHFMKENRTISYQQIWQQSVSQQLEKYYLKLHMQQFEKEEDDLKKEEMVFNMIREFDSENIQDYLEKAKRPLYEQFIHVLYLLTGREKDNQRQTGYMAGKENLAGNVWSEKNEKSASYPSEDIKPNNNEDGKEIIEHVSAEGYPSLQERLVLAEYKKTEDTIMDILHNSEEITRNIVLGKVEEYKEIFYEYVKEILNKKERPEHTKLNSIEQESIKQEDLAHDFSGQAVLEQEILNNKEYEGKVLEESLDDSVSNPEIFTDYELEVLLDSVQEKKATEALKVLKKKLNLIAIKEITESFLEENTSLLQKDRLQLIYNVLENASFLNEHIEEKRIQMESKVSLQKGMDQTKDMEQINNIEQMNNVKQANNMKQKGRKIVPWISAKFQKQFKQVQKERTRSLLLSIQKGDETTTGADRNIEGVTGKRKDGDFGVYDIKQIFETGSLPERKLLYLALENSIDRVMIEKHNQSEKSFVGKDNQSEKSFVEKYNRSEESLLEKDLIVKELIQAKQKIIQTTDTEKLLSGDWRFLMTKQRAQEMIQALSGLQPDTRALIEENVQKTVKEFCDYLTMKKELFTAESRNYEQGEEVFKAESENYEQGKELFKAENGSHEQGEELFKAESGDYGQGEEIFRLTERRFAQLEKEGIKQERGYTTEKSKASQKLWEIWETFFDKKEFGRLYEFISEQAESSFAQTVEKEMLLTQKADIKNVSDMIHNSDAIRQRHIPDIVTMFETGSLPERKLLYLALENGMDRVMTEKQNQSEKSFIEKDNHFEKNLVEKDLIMKELIQAKGKIIQTTDTEKILSGDWRFLMTKQREQEMIQALSGLQPETRVLIEENVKKTVKEFCDYLNMKKELFTAESGNYEQGEEEFKAESRNYEQGKELFKVESRDYEPEKEIFRLTEKQFAQLEKEGIKQERGYTTEKSKASQKLWEIWETFFDKKEFGRLYKFISEQTESSSAQTVKTEIIPEQTESSLVQTVEKEMLLTQKADIKNLFDMIHNSDVVRQRHVPDIGTTLETGSVFHPSIQNLTWMDIVTVFETGSLPERKLLYLALENSIDRVMIEKHNQSEKSFVEKDLIQAKGKIIQTTDAEKIVSGDWRFLMTKQRAEEILQALSGLQPETRELLEATVQKSVKKFCDYLKIKKELFTAESGNYELEKEVFKAESRNYEQGKELFKTESGDYEQGKEIFRLTEKQFAQLEKEGIKQEREYTTEKSGAGQKLWEVWETFFRKKELGRLYQFISEQTEGSPAQTVKKEILLTQKADIKNLSNMTHDSDAIRQIHIPDIETTFKTGSVLYPSVQNLTWMNIVTTFETGSLPERKLLYLALENSMDRVMTEKHNQFEKSLIEKDNQSEKSLIAEDLIQAKKKIIQTADAEKIVSGNWQFLMKKQRADEMIQTLSGLHQETAILLEEAVQKTVKEILSVKNTKENKYLSRHERFYKVLNLPNIEGKVMLLHSNKVVNLHILKEKNIKTKDDFANIFYIDENIKNVNKSLKIRQLYDKIMHMSSLKQLSDVGFRRETAKVQQFYQFSKQLKKRVYLSMEDGGISMNLLTQKNNNFMQPPIEREGFAENKTSQFALSEKIKYHEESVKLILNYAKEKKITEQQDYKRSELLEQEKMLRELEGSLLDYRTELEDKSERLEVVEKQIEKQEKTLQLLKESQGSVSQKNLKESEVRQFMGHLKEELKMEQMRRGKI